MPKKLEKSENYAIAFNRLIDVCNANNVSISSLLDKFATSRSAITAWKKGNISTDVLASIANELDVSLDYLLTGKEKSSPTETLTADEQELLTYYNKLDAFQKGQLLERAIVLSEVVKKPLKKQKNTVFIEYYSLPVSAGTGIYLDNSDKDMIEAEENELTSEANFALRVSGDSMQPEFYDGDTILVKTQPSVELGEIGVFILNGEGYVKKFGGDCLISINPKYKNIKLHDYDEISCKGRVIGVL